MGLKDSCCRLPNPSLLLAALEELQPCGYACDSIERLEGECSTNHKSNHKSNPSKNYCG